MTVMNVTDTGNAEFLCNTDAETEFNLDQLCDG